MFWLDGSSTLSFKISSPDFASKGLVEEIDKAFALVENQAQIVRSCVETGNFNHWCHAASELVDLTADLLFTDTYYQFVYGFISGDEQLHCFTELNAQHVKSVCFAMFERARERLFENSRSRPFPIQSSSSNSIPLHKASLPPDTAKRGNTTSIRSLLLPQCELTTTTTADSPQSAQPALLVSTPDIQLDTASTVTTPAVPRREPAPTGNPDASVSVATPTALHRDTTNSSHITPPLITTLYGPRRAAATTATPPLPRRHPVPVGIPNPPPYLASNDNGHRSNDRAIAHTREEEGEEQRGEEEMEMEDDEVGNEDEDEEQRGEESTEAGAVSKPPTPPLTTHHERGQVNDEGCDDWQHCCRCCALVRALVSMSPPCPTAPHCECIHGANRARPRQRQRRSRRRRRHLLHATATPPSPTPIPNHPGGQDIRKRRTRRRRRRRRHRCRTTAEPVGAVAPNPTPSRHPPSPTPARTRDKAPSPIPNNPSGQGIRRHCTRRRRRCPRCHCSHNPTIALAVASLPVLARNGHPTPSPTRQHPGGQGTGKQRSRTSPIAVAVSSPPVPAPTTPSPGQRPLPFQSPGDCRARATREQLRRHRYRHRTCNCTTDASRGVSPRAPTPVLESNFFYEGGGSGSEIRSPSKNPEFNLVGEYRGKEGRVREEPRIWEKGGFEAEGGAERKEGREMKEKQRSNFFSFLFSSHGLFSYILLSFFILPFTFPIFFPSPLRSFLRGESVKEIFLYTESSHIPI